MFTTDAKLFLEAFLDVRTASDKINDCIRVVSDTVIDAYTSYDNCLYALKTTCINDLISAIETTRDNLLGLDASFAEEYERRLGEISLMDESSLTEYNIELSSSSREYYSFALEMYEKQEANVYGLYESQRMLITASVAKQHMNGNLLVICVLLKTKNV